MSVGTYALTTLANLKQFLAINNSTNDTLLENCIDRTTDLFETATGGRKLKARDYSYVSTADAYDPDNAILDGNQRDQIVLPQYPVNSVTTMRINEIAIDERASVQNTGWVLDKKAGIITLVGYIYTLGIRNIELVYNAGYSTVPEDLESACIEQAAWLLKQSSVGGNLLGVSAKTLADGSTSYTVRDLLPQVKMVLENYKRRFAL